MNDSMCWPDQRGVGPCASGDLTACAKMVKRQHFTMAASSAARMVQMIENISRSNVSGDWIECGVWRGGMSALARAAQRHFGMGQRRTILADSFHNFPADASGEDAAIAAVDNDGGTVEQVASRFAHAGLLSERVVFVEGFFNETLCHLDSPLRSLGGGGPLALSILRVDGDMYLSVAQSLCCLYDAVTVGGYVVIDDWGS